MARRRLNKKVAFIGSAILTILLLGAILLVFHLSRPNPDDVIKDGDTALREAREATDEQTKKQKYEEAISKYAKAEGLVKSDSIKVDMFFKLADVFIALDHAATQ